jgi:hypothetical protein
MLTAKELAKRDWDNNRRSSSESFNENFGQDYAKWVIGGEDYRKWQPIWAEYCEEWRKLERDYFAPKINEFFDKLDVLAAELGISYSFGCGCCGGCSLEIEGRTYGFTGRDG